MQGHPEVIQQLQSLLEGELTSIDQYFIHSRYYEDMGLNALYERLNHEMDEEKDHADRIIKRMLFLEAKPDLSKARQLNPGETVAEMLANDLQLEYQVAAALRTAIACCETHQDYQTRDMLLGLLADTEEDHLYWLEKQLRLIKLIGEANYLQSQM
ncbi:bacterioferritin [Allopseudospirillum japonicum]|uniref:Bacterioferritin n=1 Tax=Allopseudospirillum japonicum TaxID=64971 RepID=A0A1H6U5P5_9GAMM|nr:bacterioferritin [Allopseudospirillum japonicum]SEI83680.1 bacterioferritin [Allopseudospirillum japonicum]